MTTDKEANPQIIPSHTAATSLGKRLILSLKLFVVGYAKVGQKHGLNYYVFLCKKHGRVVNYPHGFAEYLVCRKCDMERISKRSVKVTGDVT